MRKKRRVIGLELPGAKEAEHARFRVEFDRNVVVSGVQQIGGEARERAGRLARAAGADQQHATRRLAYRRRVEEQGAAIRKPPMEDLAKRRGRLPEGQLIGVAAPEPGSRAPPLVRTELTERGPARKVPSLVGRVDGRPARAAWSERRKRRRWRPRVLGVPDVNRQLGFARFVIDQMVEGGAQLLGESRSCETQPHGRIPYSDRALDEVGSMSRALEAFRKLLDRGVEGAVGRLRRRWRHRQRHAAIPACRPRERGRAG